MIYPPFVLSPELVEGAKRSLILLKNPSTLRQAQGERSGWDPGLLPFALSLSKRSLILQLTIESQDSGRTEGKSEFLSVDAHIRADKNEE
jgi:hypothetical protein